MKCEASVVEIGVPTRCGGGEGEGVEEECVGKQLLREGGVGS